MSLRNPVRYPVKYYSWQDDKAPQLTDADGVIKTILKACLVTGYGTMQGAGWTALFEDAYRIVLRRPLRTGSPPDIKIENGTFSVGGSNVTRHRIVAQDNPASLDDTNELYSVNLLARDSNVVNEWHCFVTDFAILLFYKMSESTNGSDGNHLNAIYIGSMQKLDDGRDEPFFVYQNPNVSVNGTTSYGYALLDNATGFIDVKTKKKLVNKCFLTISGAELSINNDYFAQKVLLDNVAVLPFLTSMTNNYVDKVQKQVSINSRNMMRIYNVPYGYDFKRPLYVPIDYWEL